MSVPEGSLTAARLRLADAAEAAADTYEAHERDLCEREVFEAAEAELDAALAALRTKRAGG